MLEVAEIARMSLAERLHAMELLWRSMSGDSNHVKSPAWHKQVLAKRLDKVESGEGEFLTLAQLKKRLVKRAK